MPGLMVTTDVVTLCVHLVVDTLYMSGVDTDRMHRRCRSGACRSRSSPVPLRVRSYERTMALMYMYGAARPHLDPGFLNPGHWTGLVRPWRCVPDLPGALSAHILWSRFRRLPETRRPPIAAALAGCGRGAVCRGQRLGPVRPGGRHGEIGGAFPPVELRWVELS